MKFSCGRNELHRACQRVANAIPARTTKDVLTSVKVSTGDNRASVVAFDHEVGIRYAIGRVSTLRPGSACIDHDRLTKVLAASDCDDVMVAVDGGTARLTLGLSRVDLLTREVDTFPDLPEIETGDAYHEVGSQLAHAAIRRTMMAVDKKDVACSKNFCLKGLLWEADGKGAVHVVGTDTNRMAAVSCPAKFTGDATPTQSILPDRAVRLLLANLADDNLSVKVYPRRNTAVFKVGDSLVYSVLVAGRYAPWQQVIGQTRRGGLESVAVPADALARCVRQALIVTDDESRRAEVSVGGGRLTIKTGGSAVGSGEAVLELPDYAGGEKTVCFNPHHLADFLAAVDRGTEVVMDVVDNGKPVLFKSGDDYSYLIMTMSGGN